MSAGLDLDLDEQVDAHRIALRCGNALQTVLHCPSFISSVLAMVVNTGWRFAGAWGWLSHDLRSAYSPRLCCCTLLILASPSGVKSPAGVARFSAAPVGAQCPGEHFSGCTQALPHTSGGNSSPVSSETSL